MPAVNVYGASDFVSPKLWSENDAGGMRFDSYTQGDVDASMYHTLVGVSGLKVFQPEKIITILRKAKQLFTSISLEPFFFANFQRNQFRSELHAEFLMDTVEYIKTGKRKMNIRMWMQLLCVPEGKVSKKYTSKIAYTMKPECYRHLGLQQWVSHDEGLVDLVYSLYIIFGKYTAWE